MNTKQEIRKMTERMEHEIKKILTTKKDECTRKEWNKNNEIYKGPVLMRERQKEQRKKERKKN
jgi:hypothetical protein